MGIVLQFESYKLQGPVPDLGNLMPRLIEMLRSYVGGVPGVNTKYKSKTNIFIETIVFIYTVCTQELGRYTITRLPTLLSAPRYPKHILESSLVSWPAIELKNIWICIEYAHTQFSTYVIINMSILYFN